MAKSNITMKTELMPLGSIALNEANPREIADIQFHKLIDSILCLPQMLQLRPVVVDSDMTALGGNQRTKALLEIAGMEEDALIERLHSLNGYKKKPKERQTELEQYWRVWHDSPNVPCVKASELSNAEKQEFIIRDNVEFGAWDWGKLADWDVEELKDWGVADWGLGSDSDIDGLFEEGGNTKEKDIKITIEVPLSYQDRTDDITNAIKEAISEWEGCRIK